MVYRYGYEDAGPRVKQFGHFEDAADEQIDPRILEAEREKARQLQKAMESSVGQTRLAMRWTETGIVYEKPATRVGETAARLANGEIDTSKNFPDPPPPELVVNLATALPPSVGPR